VSNLRISRCGARESQTSVRKSAHTKSATRARLSAFHYGSYRQGFRPLGATPGQASWDVAGRSILYGRSNRGAKILRSYAGVTRARPSQSRERTSRTGHSAGQMMPEAARERSVSFHSRAPHSLRFREYPRPKASFTERDSLNAIPEMGTIVNEKETEYNGGRESGLRRHGACRRAGHFGPDPLAWSPSLPLRFTTRGRISERIPATHKRPRFASSLRGATATKQSSGAMNARFVDLHNETAGLDCFASLAMTHQSLQALAISVWTKSPPLNRRRAPCTLAQA
jgi:hypothetical protein